MLSMLGEQSIDQISANDIHILHEQYPDILNSFHKILNMNDTIKRSNAIIELCNQLNSLIFKKVDPNKKNCIGVLGESTCALSILKGNLKDINLSFQSEQAGR